MIFYLTFITLLSVIFLLVAMRINKYTKLPMLLIYVIFGWILQYGGIHKLPELVSNIDIYIQMVSITLIYLLAGQAFNMKKQDQITLKIGLVPIMLTVLFNVVILIIVQAVFFPQMEVPIWMFVTVLGIAATGTPVLFLIQYNKLNPDLRVDEGVLKILNGELFDQIPGMFLILIPITIGIGMMNATGSASSTVIQMILACVLMALFIFIGYIVGKYTLKIVNKFTTNIRVVIVTILIMSIAVVNLVPFLTGQYLLVAVGFGLSMNINETERLQQLTMETNKLAAMFAFPMMFASLGISIALTEIFNLKMLIVSIIILLFVPVFKSFVVRTILVRNNYNPVQIRVGIAFTMLTGSTYINMAISFKPYFQTLGYTNLDHGLSIVGIILYIFSIIMLPIYAKEENNVIDKFFRLS